MGFESNLNRLFSMCYLTTFSFYFIVYDIMISYVLYIVQRYGIERNIDCSRKYSECTVAVKVVHGGLVGGGWESVAAFTWHI